MHFIKFDSLLEKFAGLVLFQVLCKSRYFNLIFIKNHMEKSRYFEGKGENLTGNFYHI